MPVNEHRIIEQVDRMVASGRITEEEVGRLRAAEGSAAFEEVVAAIRARHAQVHTDAAVAEGRISQSEADGFLTSRAVRRALEGAAEPHQGHALTEGMVRAGQPSSSR